jgi:hypothetical protein
MKRLRERIPDAVLAVKQIINAVITFFSPLLSNVSGHRLRACRAQEPAGNPSTSDLPKEGASPEIQFFVPIALGDTLKAVDRLAFECVPREALAPKTRSN